MLSPENRDKILSIFKAKGIEEMLAQFQPPPRPLSVKILSLGGRFSYHLINEVLPKIMRQETGKYKL